jgi:fucose 4-O-acetylase-like acetyltransferase
MNSAFISFIKEALSYQDKKLGWINLVRGITIIMVVYRHSFEGLKYAGISRASTNMEMLNELMYTFRMPLFFVISGILMNLSLQKRSLNQYIVKRAELILYPYVIWSAIQITLQFLAPMEYVNSHSGWKTYLYILYNPRAIQQFWYLYALFNVMFIYSILKVKCKLPPIAHLALALAMFFTSQYCHHHKIDLYFVNDIFLHYIYFATGDLIASFVLDPENRKKLASAKTLAVVMPVFILLHYLYLRDSSVMYHPVILAIAFSGVIFTIVISIMLEDVKGLQWLKVLGANSLNIYLMHVMIMAANRAFLAKFLHIQSMPVLMFSNLIIGLVLPVLLYHFFMKSGLWWLFTPRRPVGLKPNTSSNTQTNTAI